MSLIANGAGEQPTGFYNGVATQSLRLDNSASSLLTRTPPAGDRKKWLWSAWIKRCDTGRDQDFFTAEGSGSQLFSIMITDSDKIQIYGASAVLLLTSQVLRDLSAWYHIAIASDTTQATATNRLKLYINGSEVTSFDTDNRASYAQDTDYGINSNVKHNIGSNQAGGNFGDYYIAEVNFIDGLSFFSDTSGTANTSFNIDSFGELKNGVWIPKKYTGSYGTQGFHLEFKQTGDGSSTASSTTIGADTANSNHYKDTNLDAYDSNMSDSPENNFCTLNHLYFLTASTHLSEGNLQLTHEATAHRANAGTMFSKTGKWYFEVRNKTDTSSSSVALGVGLQDISKNLDYSTGDNNYIYYCNNNTPLTALNTTNNGLGSFVAGAGDIMQVAYDADSGKLFIGKNNTYVAADAGTDGNPATGDNPSATLSTTIDYIPFVGTYNNEATANFGQDDTFAGAISSAGNTDGNGRGVFKYAPPSGYLALCTANLPEPTISPAQSTQSDDHFNTLLYSGDDTDGRSITGVGFQPDWTWIKARNASGNYHLLFDSSRGATKNAFSNDTSAEVTQADSLSAFNSDGFTVSDNAAAADMNASAHTYVAWNWKANGGTTSSNTDGSITSTVQANTTAGFSIVTYEIDSSGVKTVGHGLTKAPELIINKGRDSASAWWTFTTVIDGTVDYVRLDDTTAKANDSLLSVPTSSVFSQVENYTLQQNVVSYCFHSVEGYSRIGKFTGNGVADGAFVYTGFRPAWVIIKRTNSTGSWNIADSKRSPENEVDEQVQANLSNAESTSFDFDFTSNGFKARTTDSARNASGSTYIYMAFGETFKYANAR